MPKIVALKTLNGCQLDLWLPNLNQLLSLHYHGYNKTKKQFQAVVVPLLRRQMQPVTAYPVQIEFGWYAPHRRADPDNIAGAGSKLLLDAMQVAGILANDGYKQINGLKHSFYLDPQRPHIEVQVISSPESKPLSLPKARKRVAVAEYQYQPLSSDTDWG